MKNKEINHRIITSCPPENDEAKPNQESKAVLSNHGNRCISFSTKFLSQQPTYDSPSCQIFVFPTGLFFRVNRCKDRISADLFGKFSKALKRCFYAI